MKQLIDLKGVGPKTLEKLNLLNIFSVADLMRFLPKNYVDLDAVSSLDDALEGEYVLLSLSICSVSKPFRKGKLQIFSARGLTESGKKVKLTWYNANYASKNITVGAVIKCYGKIKIDGGYEIINGVYETGESNKFSGIKPIYPTKGLIPQATFIGMVADAASDYREDSVITHETCAKFGLNNLTDALVKAHKPELLEDIYRAKERVFLEESVRRVCAFNLLNENIKRKNPYKIDLSEVEKLEKSLPYKLTASQKGAIEQVKGILQSGKFLNAMLSGDVGSGKTIVSLFSCFFAFLNGKQSALIAPTEILAHQHFKSFSKILSPLGVKVALVAGGLPEAEKKAVKKTIAEGLADIVIGTHAVISKSVSFKNLALAIIDEQHRFGVRQRTQLLQKGEGVDAMTLTATPIPRSLRLTMFGDIEVLTIDTRHQQSNIKTKIVGKDKRAEMLNYIVKECAAGKQAFLVVPKVVDDEGLDLQVAETLYKELNKKYKSEVNIGLVHGKLKSNEKERVMQEFADNNIQILVATTVIEVGIDVPNASLLVIFNAEFFGLASLHQLRGRIGRDGSDAYCFLYTEKTKDDEILRLKALEQEQNGLKLAEIDYEMRGAGEWLGESQSGKKGFTPSIKLVKLAACIAKTTPYSEVFKEYAERLKMERVSIT
jgi:ATP-dependent DNA helicase RecG